MSQSSGHQKYVGNGEKKKTGLKCAESETLAEQLKTTVHYSLGLHPFTSLRIASVQKTQEMYDS